MRNFFELLHWQRLQGMFRALGMAALLGVLAACPGSNGNGNGGGTNLPVFDGAPYNFPIDEGSYSMTSTGAVDTVSAMPVTRYAITAGDTDTRFAIDDMGAITAIDELDFEDTAIPNSYSLTVTAYNGAGDDAPSATAMVTIMVTDVVYVTAADLTVQEDATPLALMLSAVDGSTTYTVAGIRSVDTPNTPFSVAAGPPLPTALTVDPDQLDVEDDTKPDSYSDVVITIEIDGGGLDNDVEIITVGTITVTGVPGFLNSPPTIFLREDGMFVAVGETAISPTSASIDLAETSEYTFVKGDFVPSGVTLNSVAPASGVPSFSIADTILTVTSPENFDFEDEDKDSFVLTITDGRDTSAMTTLTMEIADLQDGESDEPYTIASVTELQSIDTGFSNEVITTALSRADSLAAHYLLTADLDMTGDSDAIANFDPIGDCRSPDNPIICAGGTTVMPFRGNFDGGGNTITNLTINRSSLQGVGLFANISEGSVHHLFLKDVNISGRNFVGGIAGVASSASRIYFVAVTGVINVHSAEGGGIIGNSSNTRGFALFANVSMLQMNNQNSLIGLAQPVSIFNAHAAGTVRGSGSSSILNIAQITSSLRNVYGRSLVMDGGGGLIGSTLDNDFLQAINVYWDTESSNQSMPVGRLSGPGTLRSVEDWATMGIIGLNTAGMQGLTASASNWQTEFSPGIDLSGDGMVDDTEDMRLSVRCDVDGDGAGTAGVEDDEYLWNFGTSAEYPALNCMPISLDEQRAPNRR